MSKRVLKKKTTKKRSTRRKSHSTVPPEQVWKGNRLMSDMLVPVDDVKANPGNTRRHAEKDISATAASMLEHGQQWPILVQPDDLVIMAGEGRWLAAKKLGWTHVAVLASDIKDDGERALFSIRDNRTAELSEWDVPELSQRLQALNERFDLPDTGLWEGYELEPLLEMRSDLLEQDGAPDKSSGGEGDSRPDMGAPLILTMEQRGVVDRAVKAVRENEGYDDISEGRAIELVCGDFLAGPMPGEKNERSGDANL